jgi:hypothetical protein
MFDADGELHSGDEVLRGGAREPKAPFPENAVDSKSQRCGLYRLALFKGISRCYASSVC